MLTVTELADIIVEFVTSRTAAEGRALLLRNPGLLGPEVDDLFDDLIEAAAIEGQTDTLEALAGIYRIIAKARRIGLEAATAELLRYDDSLGTDV
ncbi:hypothetical protein NE236_32975 [Actinoallomurus purpureus]|uniref:hypothetical protein n=1 Tax=Actinoallomurus purpureus TaxID=478114 RepID=UPI0020939C9B|nr:hypothetical protein [Actinoallomurus purpureus]MCO6009796.1 hypothetical protein [Actinoallomurus purpureus]